MAFRRDNRLLPLLADPDDYVAAYADHTLWLPAIEAICQRHRIPIAGLERTTLGTHIVYRSGDRIIKLYCRFWPESFTAEAACLDALAGMPIPELVDTGEIEGWPYLIMTAVEGTPTREVWDELGMDEKVVVMNQLGEFIRRLHDRRHIDALPGNWDSFLSERIRNLGTHHAISGEWERWAREQVTPLATRRDRLVVLHADLTRDHVLLVNDAGRWRLSAVIDFGDAMIGPPSYEFTAPLVDHAFGEPALARAMLEAYGTPLTAATKRELTRYFLVHQYWRLGEMPGNPLEGPPEQFTAMAWGAPG